eukprot:35104-Chlamydomonas_euryale.AAC.6
MHHSAANATTASAAAAAGAAAAGAAAAATAAAALELLEERLPKQTRTGFLFSSKNVNPLAASHMRHPLQAPPMCHSHAPPAMQIMDMLDKDQSDSISYDEFRSFACLVPDWQMGSPRCTPPQYVQGADRDKGGEREKEGERAWVNPRYMVAARTLVFGLYRQFGTVGI